MEVRRLGMIGPGGADDIALKPRQPGLLVTRQGDVRTGSGEPRRALGDMRLVACLGVRDHRFEMVRDRRRRLGERIAVGFAGLRRLAEV